MKAKALKSFTMGSTTYTEGRELDLPEDRVLRLVGEGLVSIVEEKEPTPTPPPPEESPKQPVPPKAPEQTPAPKKGGKFRRRKS